MPALTLARLRERGQSFMERISREMLLAHAGHKPTADLSGIYREYDDVLGKEALELTLDAFKSANDDADLRSARSLLDWQVDSQSSRAVAEHDEREIAWEASAVVILGEDRQVPYSRVAIEIANTSDRTERNAMDDARARLVASELAPLRMERLQKERDFSESLELGVGYIATFEALSGFSLATLASQCRSFLRDTEAMWSDVHRELSRRVLKVSPTETTRADALALMRAPQFDAAFPVESLERQVMRQATEMGIDPLAGGRIMVDLEERPGKRARAFCAPVRVPDEVHLVLRPHGGQRDWSTYLHELGHALHFAYMRPDLDFEFRWVGDNSITEGYAMLFDHRMQDREWLLRYSDLDRSNVDSFLRMAGAEELHFIRRYCAKLLYEIELYSGSVAWSELPDVYASTLTEATTFRYQTSDAFIDVDPRFYSARYLRAWQLQSVLNEALTEQFNEDWYRNPHCGPWMVRELFGEGQRELAHELAERVSGRELSFTPLVSAIEKMLS
jgi:hypothetical protein